MSSRSNVRCHLTGAEAKYVDASAKWVLVPEVLLLPPVYNPLGPFVIESNDSVSSSGLGSASVKEEKEKESVTEELVNSSSSSASSSTPTAATATSTATGDVTNGTADKRSTRVRLPSFTASQLIKERSVRHVDQLVALESAVLKVAAAREFAYLQRQKLEERLEGLIAVLPTTAFYKIPYESDAELGRMAPADISRGNPLGRDRHGNEYWLLFAQRRMSLVAQGLAVTFLNGPQGATYNPQVFLRETTGVWSVHCGQNIPELVAEFSSSILCEHYLRENMIEGLHYTKKSLLSRHLVFKPMQLEWVERQARAESYLRDTANMLAGLDVISAVKKLETLWAKFIEVRCFVHNGYTFRNEPDTVLSKSQDRHEKDALQRRLKKMRDTYQEEIVEHHPVKGWYRFDPMGRLRELWCATSADRMHADPMVCQQMILTAKRSKFLSTLIPYLPPPVAPVPAVAGIPLSAPVPTADAAILIQSSGPQVPAEPRNSLKAESRRTATFALPADTITLPPSLSAATTAIILPPLALPSLIAPIATFHATVTTGSTNEPSISSTSPMQIVDPLSSSLIAIESSIAPADVIIPIEYKIPDAVGGEKERGQEAVIIDTVDANAASSSALSEGQGHGQVLEQECKMSSIPGIPDKIGDSSGHAIDAAPQDISPDTAPMDTGDSDIPGKIDDVMMNGSSVPGDAARTVGTDVVAPARDEDEMDVEISQDAGQSGVTISVIPLHPVKVDGLAVIANADSPPLVEEEENDGDRMGDDDMDEEDGEGDLEGDWTPPSASQGSPRQGPSEASGSQASSGLHSGMNSARVKVRNSCANKVKTMLCKLSVNHFFVPCAATPYH